MDAAAAVAAVAAEGAAVAAAAAADANLGDLLTLLEDDAEAVNINAALPVILGQLATLGQVRAGIDRLAARLAAVELRTEAGYAAGPPHGAATAGAAAGARAGRVGAGTGLPPSGGPAADIADAIAQGMAQALRVSRRGRGDGSCDDDEDDAVVPARAFTDGQAKRVAKGRDELTFFQLPSSARTSYPAPFRMDTLQYQSDAADGAQGADEAKHVFIVGAWSTLIHNELLSFINGPEHGDVQRLQAMLICSRLYHHEHAELCAARYDVLREDNDAVAAQLQERLLYPPDVHASRARCGLQVEAVNMRDRALNKVIAANEVRKARRRGTRGGGGNKRGGGADPSV